MSALYDEKRDMFSPEMFLFDPTNDEAGVNSAQTTYSFKTGGKISWSNTYKLRQYYSWIQTTLSDWSTFIFNGS